MIKIIAFDLVGVLVKEKDIELTTDEDKLERMFGPNLNDSDYLMNARKIVKKDSTIIRMTEEIISKLYQIKEKGLFEKIKKQFKDIKIVIATNHVSFIRNYIGETFGVDYLDDVVISAEVHKIKPNTDFYQLLLDKYNIKANELLFLDDNQSNIDGAKKLGINTIKVEKNSNLFEEITRWMMLNN